MNASLIYNCAFFGHKSINNRTEIELKVKKLIIDLIINKGVKLFYFGGLGEFDDLCFSIVNELKSNNSNLKTAFCYSDDNELLRLKRQHLSLNKQYDNYVYFPLKYNYWYYRILYRNYEIINASDYIIFYVEEDRQGGALSALNYAKKLKKQIYNVLN